MINWYFIKLFFRYLTTCFAFCCYFSCRWIFIIQHYKVDGNRYCWSYLNKRALYVGVFRFLFFHPNRWMDKFYLTEFLSVIDKRYWTLFAKACFHSTLSVFIPFELLLIKGFLVSKVWTLLSNRLIDFCSYVLDSPKRTL